MVKWGCIESGKVAAQDSMQLDTKLLKKLPIENTPIVHFYDWEGLSITHGFFMKPEQWLNPHFPYPLQIAKRPTGGGVVIHEKDFAFSILLPASHPNSSLNTLDNYRFIHQIMIKAITDLLGRNLNLTLCEDPPRLLHQDCLRFCSAQPSKYDIMLGGLKIGGGAQRRTKAGFLHQGTLFFSLPLIEILTHLLIYPELVSAIYLYSGGLLSKGTEKQFDDLRRGLKVSLLKNLEESC